MKVRPNLMKICIDIDNVLLDSTSLFLQDFNAEHGTKYRIEEVMDYDFSFADYEHEYCYVKTREYIRRWGVERAPLLGAQEAVRLLGKNYELVVLTSRPPEELEAVTEGWIEKYFPGCFQEILYSEELGMGKGEVCRKYGAQVLIEDEPRSVRNAAENNVSVLMMHQPWNAQLEPHEKIHRVRDWKEIVSVLTARFTATSKAAPLPKEVSSNIVK